MSKMSPAFKWIIAICLILIAYMAYQDFTPSPPAPAHGKPPMPEVASAQAISPIDLNAHFTRYTGGKRDPFLPTVFAPNSGGQGDLSALGKEGSWTLTGINRANGVVSALVQDDASGNSAFLQTGDTWNGLKVLAIGSDSITLENAMGEQTHLSFPVPPPPSAQTASNTAPAVPSLSQIAPLPAIPTGANQGAPAGVPAYTGGFGGGRGGGRRGRGGRGGGGFGGGGF